MVRGAVIVEVLIQTLRTQVTPQLNTVPYILESNPHPNLIRTSFCRFLKGKKKLVRGSNPYLSFNRPLPTRRTDSVMSDDGESDE